jgi:hypothetical protein
MFQVFQMFHSILQLFYMDVAKVDQDVAYVACCNGLYMYVASSCSQCFICFFRRMLHVCYLDVVYVFTHMMEVFYL